MKDDRSTWVYIFDFVPSAGLLMAIKKPLFLQQFSTFRATKGMCSFVDVGNVIKVIFIAKDPHGLGVVSCTTSEKDQAGWRLSFIILKDIHIHVEQVFCPLQVMPGTSDDIS